MAVFAYKALDGGRSPVQGTIAADTPRQARELLRSRGLLVQQMSDHQVAAKPSSSLFRRRGRYSAKLVSTIRELATLLAVGIPLLEALDTLIKQHRGAFQASLLVVRDRVSAGIGLAEAMAEQPDVFDNLTINMVEVGQNSGSLETVLEELAGFKERSLEMKDRVITALVYPAFIVVTLVTITLLLMTFVVPMLLENLSQTGRPLPWPTRVVKTVSDVVVGYGWLLAIAAGVLLVSLISFLQTSLGRRLWHTLLLRMPLLGTMARKQAIARIALVTSTLMKSGIVFLKAIEIAAHSTPNLVLRGALEQVGREVSAGREIGPSLESTTAFPPLVVQIFAVGQQSGRLEEMLDRLAIDYERQVASLSARLVALFEPAIIVVLAVCIGFILFATFLPILEAGNALQM